MPADKKDEYIEFTFEVPLTNETFVLDTSKGQQDINFKDDPNIGSRKTIAMIGDRFMRGQFFSAIELEKSKSMWEGTLHDINHMGTTYRTGFSAQSNILYFVGWQDNVQYDEESKSLSMSIHPKLNTHFGQDWQAFVELCDDAGRVANVSISFLGKVKRVRASTLPEGSNYSDYGYKDNDMVDYIYDVRPRALSTVLQGLCDDKQGCGIATNNSDCEDDSCKTKITNTTEKKPKENKENVEKRTYLEKRLKKIGGK